eukprot:5311036-Heterocapsa_arctica.AAC.1
MRSTQWNRIRMVSALSFPQLAAPFRCDLEEWAGTPPVQEALQAIVMNHDVDPLWHLINEAVNLAGEAFSSRPA